MNRGEMRMTSTERMQAIADAILRAHGDLDPVLRQAIFDRVVSRAYAATPAHPAIPDVLERFVDVVSVHAYRIEDADLGQLRAAGFSEDAILEATLSAAVGAGASRLSIGLAALQAGR